MSAPCEELTAGSHRRSADSAGWRGAAIGPSGPVARARPAHLRRSPSQGSFREQHRANQVLLGHRLVGLAQRAEPFVRLPEVAAEVGELRYRPLPFRSRTDAVGEKVLSKQLTLHDRV